MDSENSTITENKIVPGACAAVVSAVSIIGGGDGTSVRIVVDRDLSAELSSFTVAYRFSGLGKGGNITESRFFSLVYDREGLKTKDKISIRFKAPDGYNVVGCTAYISKIEYADGTAEEFSFGDEQSRAVSCTADGVDISKLGGDRKKLSKKVKTVLISAAAVAATALIFWGGLELKEYNGVKNVVNGLINDGRYSEAYMVAEECGSATLKRVTCSNIVKKSISERDYKTAYVFSTISGKEKTVFSRVEYEIINSGADALSGDAMAVLKKLDDDEEYDRTLKECISKACETGDYPRAIAAAQELRSVSERALTKRNLIVDGVCYYSTCGDLTGSAKYDRALDFFFFYMSGDDTADASVAAEIVNRCIERGDCAGAVVLSTRFNEHFGSFEINPASVKITADNNSISNSLDCAYQLLTDEQKRAYHAQTLALSEEMKVVNNGFVAGADVSGAVSVATYENRTAVLLKNGSVVHIKNDGHNTVSDIPSGVNGVQIAVGLGHTVILNADGTVTAVGDNSYGQCNVSGWNNIVEIAAGRNFTLGLRADGTLVACGSNKCGQCGVSGYNNVISVEACDQTSVLLFSDGTVSLCGDRSMGLYKANGFTNVESIKAGGCTVVVRKTDGTFDMADGCVNASSGDVSSWSGENIVDFAVGSQCIAHTDKNGRTKIIGDGAPN